MFFMHFTLSFCNYVVHCNHLPVYQSMVVVLAFFLACEDFERMFDCSFPAGAFFLKWRLARAH